MNLTDALKWLAENEPEKYCLEYNVFYWGENAKSKNYGRYVDNVDQDDIDEILAGIGMEYEVRRMGENWEWGAIVEPIDRTILWRVDTERIFPSKREAAQAALIAACQKKKKERDGR